MRELAYGERTLTREGGGDLICRYTVLVRTLPPPVSCDSYGLRVSLEGTDETEEVLDLTVLPERIAALAEAVRLGGVTPCALADIVADWLGE